MNKENSDERNRENVERKKIETKNETEQKQKLKIFGLNFVVVLSEEREEFIQQIKNSGKIKQIFSDTTCSKKTETENKRQFLLHFPARTTFFFF